MLCITKSRADHQVDRPFIIATIRLGSFSLTRITDRVVATRGEIGLGHPQKRE
jgi:hypothetical protein